jgi:DNA-binding GntR family transcriptional regulator
LIDHKAMVNAESKAERLFEKLSSGTLRGQIVEKIKTAILTGTLREGERLVERNLAAQFETSLTAVREGLIQLEAEGFVSKKPNATTHVTKLSLDAAENIFAVRRVLEAFAVEQAAKLATAEQAQALEAAYLELLDTAREQNAQLFILKDLALHEAIWHITANEYLEIALRRIVHPIFAFTAIRILSCHPFDLLQDAHSHLPIIEAIKAKNPAIGREAFLVAVADWLSKTKDYVFGQSERT